MYCVSSFVCSAKEERDEEKGKGLWQTLVGVKEREGDFDAPAFNCWDKN